MQFSAVLNIFIVKVYFNSIFTNDLKRKDFLKKVHSYRPSLFKYSGYFSKGEAQCFKTNM